MGKSLDMSVLVATYNRASILRETLASFTTLDLADLRVEFVIIDNNSPDCTHEVAKSFLDKLSMRYLFEPQPGKNCALNKALREVALGEVVVFTDDDVRPEPNWLTEIHRVSSRWPEYYVFGGRIRLVWPETRVPAWTSLPSIHRYYGLHELGGGECSYVSWKYPFGANYWVRRDIFDRGYRFNEDIGPHPKKRSMGSEATFLNELASAGYHMLYCPSTIVGHRIHSEMLIPKGIRKRVYGTGRGRVALKGIWEEKVYARSRSLWLGFIFLSLFKHSIRYCVAIASISGVKRMQKSLSPLSDISYRIASLGSYLERDS